MPQPFDVPAGHAPASLAAAILQNRARRLLGVDRREAVVAVVAAGGFLAVAAALVALGTGRPGPDPVLAVALVLLVAALSTVEVELGPGVGVATLLGVIPMLVLLPPWDVPALVATAMLLGAGIDVLVHRRAHPLRAIVPLTSCWFALGPTAVLLVAGGSALRPDDWWLLALAVAAGIVCDAVSTALTERAAYGRPLRSLAAALGWCALVDALLAPVAFLVGAAALEHPEALAASAAAGGLVWLLGRERRRRVDQAAVTARLEGEREDARASARDLGAILAWTREASISSTHALDAVCSAAGVVLEASVAALVEEDDDGWRVAASSAALHAAPGRRVGRFATPDRADLAEPQHVAELPAGLRALLGDDVERVLMWSVDGCAIAGAALVVALPASAPEHVGTRQRFALEVLATEARTALERTAMMARLDELARSDGLTGLPNRRHWEDELPRLLEWTRTRGERLCIALLDLDHFKAYNDAHGHGAGDRLLRSAAAAWSSSLREQDLLARYGGEEFVVALPACDLEDARIAIDRLRVVMPSGQTCSAGLAVWDGLEPMERLLERADEALYRAKDGGRNRVVVDGEELDETTVGSAR